jgi:hypothetical protein
MIVRLKKYGQITNVSVDNKIIYGTAVTPRYEKDHIEQLLRALKVDNVTVEVDE